MPHPFVRELVLAMWNDRGRVLEAVKQDGRFLQYASAQLRSDREVVLEAVKQHGLALEHACVELRSDRAVVLEAVMQNGQALEAASEELKSDFGVVREAVMQNGFALGDASATHRSDQEIALIAVREDGGAIGLVPPWLRMSAMWQAAVDCSLAVEGSMAPVFTITEIRRAADGLGLDVLSHTMAGTAVHVHVDVGGTLGDLAETLLGWLTEHGDADVEHDYVFVALPDGTVASPFAHRRLVSAFV